MPKIKTKLSRRSLNYSLCPKHKTLYQQMTNLDSHHINDKGLLDCNLCSVQFDARAWSSKLLVIAGCAFLFPSILMLSAMV